MEVCQKVPLYHITDFHCGAAYLTGQLESINQHIIQSIDLMYLIQEMLCQTLSLSYLKYRKFTIAFDAAVKRGNS